MTDPTASSPQLLHALCQRIARHAQPVCKSVTQAGIPGLIVSIARSPTELIDHVFEPVFVLVAQGRKELVIGGQRKHYGAGQYLMVSVDLPVSSRVETASMDQPCLAVALLLDPARVARFLLDTAEAAASLSMAHEPPGLAVSDAPDALLDALLRLTSLLDTPRDAAVLAPLLEREILWRLLCGPQGGMLRQIGLADGRLARVGQVIRWIRDHYAQALRVEALAEMAGMSVSSLHRHFRAITTMSPIQYQKQIRLQEARVRLLTRAQPVADVGYVVGYESPSQFSREYRRVYGRPPGQETAALNAADNA